VKHSPRILAPSEAAGSPAATRLLCRLVRLNDRASREVQPGGRGAASAVRGRNWWGQAVMRSLVGLAALAWTAPAQEPPPPAAPEKTSPQEPPAAPAQPASSLAASVWTDLRLTSELKYVGRWTDGAHDNDLLLYQTLGLGNETKDLVSVRASGLLAFDLDRDQDPTNPFYGVNDTYSGDLTARLYTAYADLNGVEGNPLRDALRRVRLGRMNLYETPVQMYVDGGALETQPLEGWADATIEAFVGLPSHLYESSSSGDFTTGAALRLAPWKGGLLRFDYMHITDEYEGQTETDDLYGARLDQGFSQEVRGGGHINFLGSDARDVSGYLTWTPADSDANVSLRYNGLFSDMKRSTLDLDYFTLFEGTFYAYDQLEVYAHKGFGDNVFVDGGAQARELRDDDNESTFNHEFRRYYLTPGLSEWPWKGLLLTGTLEIWDDGGDSFETYGGDLTQQLAEPWRASIGTYFQLYRYDVLADQEREDVWVSYLKTDYKLSKELQLRFMLELEDGDTDDYTRVILSMRWHK
jgi:hypothetical protein